MKVVVIGGTGVFGSRLAQLLIRDGHDVWIAGRNASKAAGFAALIGAKSIELDRSRDLSALNDLRATVIVDAAGPFQEYGDDPYRLARFCIERRVHYLDLSDDAVFSAGISQLDTEARRAGCFVLSGASSVPGLSSAAVSALADGLDSILAIDSAIMPGNRAPRGPSVVASILSQVGRPQPMWRGGRRANYRCWSEPKRYTLEHGLRRRAWLIGAPDLVLFPDFFGARSVIFRAGLELNLLNFSVSTYAGLRRLGILGSRHPFSKTAAWLSSLLMPFGTDRGGMIVEIVGRSGDETHTRRWTLIAEAGEGPFIPGVVVRALLRRIADIVPGARACVAEITLEEAEAALSDMAISSFRREAAAPPLFQSVLGKEWDALAEPAKRLHAVHDIEHFTGRASVERGAKPFAQLISMLFGFPPTSDDVAVTVTKRRTATGETWERNFGGHVFRSHLRGKGPPGYIVERFGPFAFELALQVADGEMLLPVERGTFFGIPLPAFMLPGSQSREFVHDGIFRFDVALSAPMGLGTIVRYRGWLTPD